ncbi:OmpA family protein [Variovorax sp. dw_954]|uniref:OmpA family protein n=1 Tax=Variovorax sp. dw_954 TaxID=2720078 RepID=UPI001BD65529|nr:OmpA family protein [Variovorax sp. dw_954]
MASPSDDDSQQNLILGIAVGVIALVLFLVIGIALYANGKAHKAKPVVAAATAPVVATVTETVVVVIPDGASIRVENGVVNFYFATGSTDLAPGAAEALAAVIQGIQGGKRAVISGYHDTTGDAAINEQLAKKRAEAVRDVLVGLGVPADKLELKKPETTEGTGSNAQARRVEVKLGD